MENVAQAAGDFGRVEYRIIEKPRYIVTRFEEGPGGTTVSERTVSERGTYDNPDIAWEVAYALCRQDHERMGYGPDDERIQYPRLPHYKKVTGSDRARQIAPSASLRRAGTT